MPKTIKLADGNEYQLAVLNLNLMVGIEEELGDKFAKLFEEGNAKNIRYLLYAVLKVNHPELTVEKVGELVTAQILTEAYEKITEMMGV